MACAAFGLNLCRFKTTFTLSESGEYKTDIQDISKPAPNEHYRSYTEDRAIGNNVRLSSVNRIDPSMVRLPAPKERTNINTASNQSTNSAVSTTEKQVRYSKGKITKPPKKAAPSATVSMDLDDVNENSVSSRTSYPSYSPPPYFETMPIDTKDTRSSTSSPALSTFKPENETSKNERASTPSNLPSSWDLINEHRRNIHRINQTSAGKNQQRQELDALSSDSSIRRRNENYA